MKTRDRLWSLDFILIIGIAFCGFTVCFMQNNGVPLYVVQLGGLSSTSGFMTVGFSVGAMAGRVAAGQLADRRGRRVTLLLSSLLFVASLVLPLLYSSLWMVLVSRIIHGLCFAAITTAGASAAADVLPSARLGEGMGYYGLAQAAGMAGGPTMGISLFHNGGYPALYAGSAVIMGAATLLSFSCRYEKRLPARRREESGGEVPQERSVIWRVFDKRALPAAAMYAVYSLASAMAATYMSLYAANAGIARPGLFFTTEAAGLVITRLTTGRLADRHGPLTVLLPASVSGVVSFVLLAASHALPAYALSGLFYGFSLGVTLPLLNMLAVKNVPPGRYGAANALFFLAADVGVGIGAILWGYASDLSGGGFTLCCLGSAGAVALMAVLGLRLRKLGKI